MSHHLQVDITMRLSWHFYPVKWLVKLYPAARKFKWLQGLPAGRVELHGRLKDPLVTYGKIFNPNKHETINQHH